MYFDHGSDCRDSAHYKTCSGRWRGVVSLGYAADGKRIRKKVADALRPVLAMAGRIPLRDLTVQDVRTALAKMAVTHSTPTLQKAQNCLTRALHHAEGRDLVRRNVSALVDTPRGREGRPSQTLTLEQAAALLEAAEDSRLYAYIVLCLLTSVRSEEARALMWDHVDLDARTISVWRSVRAHGDTKTSRGPLLLGGEAGTVSAPGSRS